MPHRGKIMKQMFQENPMKNFKTALLAGAFALASTMAFAQVTAPTSGSAGTGANIGASTKDPNTKANANTNTKVQAGGVKAGADTSVKGGTTGSGASVGTGINGSVK
jgi:hypothetical protein